MTNKTFVSDQVFKHNQTQDCWLIIQGKVYDVTPFMEDHPGGSEVLLASTGKDATDDFEDIGHSDDAKAMMDKYYIGDLEKSYKIAPIHYAPPAAPTASADDKTSESIIKILQFLAPLFFIFALAFAYAKN
ncbi:putative cytochrome b5-like heme/steroid binding domain, cytochrome b5, heme-binding protein [Helianthus annuus]|nr:putative cytochrome b5-like heme/steroid binding domain, cytochrome b5, heme-binding protein [Helianthus annuus]KAJ0564803.1 putative cytochrome b5-like heme/steroid binding domain, cytochrome b5, heme-binding protein [Helianthus annuus]KAJ0732848.1 putative cytochrome b5-like heme/steroid binding domain, cytochrome b5, heme-binding protein [Helianthus annuus]KAJ0906529.1 putative cytochrome b5-like heme/steroid binding domain-containing protein [Helianthus annuus]